MAAAEQPLHVRTSMAAPAHDSLIRCVPWNMSGICTEGGREEGVEAGLETGLEFAPVTQPRNSAPCTLAPLLAQAAQPL